MGFHRNTGVDFSPLRTWAPCAFQASAPASMALMIWSVMRSKSASALLGLDLVVMASVSSHGPGPPNRTTIQPHFVTDSNVTEQESPRRLSVLAGLVSLGVGLLGGRHDRRSGRGVGWETELAPLGLLGLSAPLPRSLEVRHRSLLDVGRPVAVAVGEVVGPAYGVGEGPDGLDVAEVVDDEDGVDVDAPDVFVAEHPEVELVIG